MSVTMDSPRVKYDVLCKTCEAIFEGGKLEAMIINEGNIKDLTLKPHLRLRSLKSSAIDGCHFCAIIFGAIGEGLYEKAFRNFGSDDLQVFTKISEEIYLEVYGGYIGKSDDRSKKYAAFYFETHLFY